MLHAVQTAALVLVAALLATGDAGAAGGGAAAVAQAEPRAVRRIAPELVAPPEVDQGELERADPREPLSDIGPATPPPTEPTVAMPRPTPSASMFRPVATAAGRLEGDGLVIALAGIEIVEPDQTCRRPDGTAWPCGAHARTAFRSYLRARAVDCDLPEGAPPPRLSVACSVGGRDLGAWLVANGWAKVTLDGPYAEEQRAAIEAGRGIFGPGPEALSADEAEPAQAPPTMPQPADAAPARQPGEGMPQASEPAEPRPRVTLPPGGAGLY